jgi:hypothetical protein
VSGPLFSAVQSQLQSTLASQFQAALNGQNNSSPFWAGLLKTLANQTDLPFPLLDRAGFALPKVNQATPGGTTTSWTVSGAFSYVDGKVTATFTSSTGLCYIDCTPMPQSQICGPNSCGMIDDGCGDAVACPTCASGAICANNKCCIPAKTCAHAICGFEQDCRAGHGTCHVRTDGLAFCTLLPE